MGDKKERLDILLVEKGFFQSRERAKTSIMAGNVFIDGRRVDKSGEKVKVEAEIVVKGNDIPYVSRGGFKLEKAIKSFDIELKDKVCLDIGASTGGFTDCMLQNGSKKVYAIDVGYGQFAWKLRTDERVVCMERTNVRYVTEDQLAEKADFASIDVSFISLTKVTPAVVNLLQEQGEVVALIKPQFEAGREKVGKKGVVRDPETHKEVIKKIVGFILSLNLSIKGLDFSPIKGPEGNIEYLVYFTKAQYEADFNIDERIDKVVQDSHNNI
ncbi:TlyA family rRNA (cytidine-2'-O)-methyltransferase [Clostridium zeae]|uniref:TlyA family rRNA (Cytidine-2'-O)-methyltransferase n=1 Tax=Clostridium zeae TaxID=2759022 RepID=A0ABQ1E6Q2_9CLOT|nr:TlyA family RNA methyltransferase [Clostridium zeae]GFZ30457.1 TlyA family rRNA (cytidine-2'-O)-methyltransferase [Clostridium zeae]